MAEQPDHDAAKKSRILDLVDFLTTYNIPYRKSQVFEYHGVSRAAGYRILASRSQRDNDAQRLERRGRPRALASSDIDKMEQLIWKAGYEARALTWQTLALEAGVDYECSWRTIQRALGTLGYRDCVACDKRWVSPSAAAKRLSDAKKALDLRPYPGSWRDVRFSSEIHFSVGPDGKARIVRKPGERPCPDCIQELPEPEKEPRARKMLHAWAAVGWNFKSQLVFYEVPNDQNGKITQEVYRDQILKGHVKRWIDRGDQFVLEEDGDSGHGPGRANILRGWKQENRLRSYFNTPASPDLSPIENAWEIPKQRIRRHSAWDVEALKALFIEAWGSLDQKNINGWIESMPQRMQDVVIMEGRMTGH